MCLSICTYTVHIVLYVKTSLQQTCYPLRCTYELGLNMSLLSGKSIYKHRLLKYSYVWTDTLSAYNIITFLQTSQSRTVRILHQFYWGFKSTVFWYPLPVLHLYPDFFSVQIHASISWQIHWFSPEQVDILKSINQALQI